MKTPFILFAVFAVVAAVGGGMIPAARAGSEAEALGLGLLVLGVLGATVLPFLAYLVRRDRKRE